MNDDDYAGAVVIAASVIAPLFILVVLSVIIYLAS